MKKFDEFINENEQYLRSLKGAMKKFMKDEYGVKIDDVYIYQKIDYDAPETDHAIIVKFVINSVQDIRKVTYLELGIIESKKLEKLFESLKKFEEDYKAYSHEISNPAVSTTMTIMFRFKENEFLNNQYLRSITGIDKYNL